MENKSFLLILALVVMTVAMMNAIVTFVKINSINDQVTGYAANVGYVNLTISASVIINVSQDVTNWGAGIVNESNNATLQTNTDGVGTVVRGNWSTADAKALVVQNLGSVNLSLNVSSDVDYTDFITSGTEARKMFWYNFTNKDAEACNFSSSISESTWYNVSKNADVVCDKMQFGFGQREIWVDTYIMVPDDATAQVRGATFTFTGTAIGN